MLEIENVTFVEFAPVSEYQPEPRPSALEDLREEIRRNQSLIRAVLHMLPKLASALEAGVSRAQKSGSEEPSPEPHTGSEKFPA